MKDENKQSISIFGRVAIYLNDDKTYSVRNVELDFTIQFGIKTPDEALAVKKAYCCGYCDGRDAAMKEPKR